MFTYQTCAAVPEQGGRVYGGGVVEVEGRVVWGAGGGLGGGVYRLDEVSSEWVKLAGGGELWATLAVCGGELVFVGGCTVFVFMFIEKVKVLRGGWWVSKTEMLVRCCRSCVVSVSGGVLLVMGGIVGGIGGPIRLMNEVQIFDGRTWHMGPPLPQPCADMSAVVHGDLVFVVGGGGMERAVWSANITDLVSH